MFNQIFGEGENRNLSLKKIWYVNNKIINLNKFNYTIITYSKLPCQDTLMVVLTFFRLSGGITKITYPRLKSRSYLFDNLFFIDLQLLNIQTLIVIIVITYASWFTKRAVNGLSKSVGTLLLNRLPIGNYKFLLCCG